MKLPALSLALLFGLGLGVACPRAVVADVDREEEDAEAQDAARPELGGGDPREFERQVIEEGEKNLEEIRKLLEEAQDSLANQQTGAGTQEKQDQAAKKMVKLIDDLSRAAQQMQQQSGSSGSQSKPGQQSSSGGQDQKSQGEQKGQQQGSPRERQDQVSSAKQQGDQQQQDQSGEQQKQDAQESPGQVPNNEVAEGDLPESGDGRLSDRLRSSKAWGRLPQKMREEMLSATDKEAPREYRDIIERYYKRISEQYTRPGARSRAR